MPTLRNQLIVIGAAGLLAMIGSMVASHKVAAQGPTDGLAVRIANPLPLPIKALDNPEKQPYTQFAQRSCNTAFCFFDFPAVPQGKRLVIEQVNVIVRPRLSTTIVDQVELITSLEPMSASFLASFTFPMTLFGPSGVAIGGNTYGTNVQTVAYAEAGTAPQLRTADRTQGDPGDFGFATISGYLVDIP